MPGPSIVPANAVDATASDVMMYVFILLCVVLFVVRLQLHLAQCGGKAIELLVSVERCTASARRLQPGGKFFTGLFQMGTTSFLQSTSTRVLPADVALWGLGRVTTRVDGLAASTIAGIAIIDREWPSDALVAAVSVIESPFEGTDFSGEFSDPWLRLRLGEPTTERDKRLADL